ncbi:MAG: HlyD family secretion protein [Alphaproteobacteria bacterium]|nr:HlyD family secretion protein [Alphaproteobacteria bacterium]
MALDLERTVVRAPFAGVTRNIPEPGRYVGGGGPLGSLAMSIVADRGVWIEANFKETDLTHVRPGLPATIRVDTYPDREWRGVVESISPATGAEFSVIPPQNATGNWVKVVQRIPVRVSIGANGPEPVLRAGMSAIVEIDTGVSRALPNFLATALRWSSASRTTRAATVQER